jgi:hypothetical protein
MPNKTERPTNRAVSANPGADEGVFQKRSGSIIFDGHQGWQAEPG